MRTDPELLRRTLLETAVPWPEADSSADHETLLDVVGDADVVLRHTRVLRRAGGDHPAPHRGRGFQAVAVETDWPEAYRINSYVRGAGDDADAEQALQDFRRFPTCSTR